MRFFYQFLCKNGILFNDPEVSGFTKKLLIFLSKGDNDELYFRDYLNEHPQIAKEYEALKLELWKRYEHDRDAYTDAKTAFIRKLTAEARRVYGDRY